MEYKTIVIDEALKTKKMAAEIEAKANEMAREGWETVGFSITKAGKAILLLCGEPVDMPEEPTEETGAEEEPAETASEEE